MDEQRFGIVVFIALIRMMAIYGSLGSERVTPISVPSETTAPIGSTGMDVLSVIVSVSD
ncbi:MAG: hypothetical protein KGO83_01700 [Paenibacillaceae bacterium]|nr:hypothetical protein [Paenibacillaceae bacterium]